MAKSSTNKEGMPKDLETLWHELQAAKTEKERNTAWQNLYANMDMDLSRPEMEILTGQDEGMNNCEQPSVRRSGQ